MWRRVVFEDWQAALAVAGFGLAVLVFAGWSIAALRLSRRSAEELARRPLDDDEKPVSPS